MAPQRRRRQRPRCSGMWVRRRAADTSRKMANTIAPTPQAGTRCQSRKACSRNAVTNRWEHAQIKAIRRLAVLQWRSAGTAATGALLPGSRQLAPRRLRLSAPHGVLGRVSARPYLATPIWRERHGRAVCTTYAYAAIGAPRRRVSAFRANSAPTGPKKSITKLRDGRHGSESCRGGHSLTVAQLGVGGVGGFLGGGLAAAPVLS